MELVLAILVFGVLRYGAKNLEKVLHRRPPIDFVKITDVPLSTEQWTRFCAFARAKGIAQKRLLAEAITFYLQEKVK